MKAIFLRGGLIQLLIRFAVGSLEDAAIVQADHFELSGGQLTPETPSPSPPPQVSRHRMTAHDWASWSATFNPLDELRTALHVMQSTWFQLWVGTWPTAIDWTAAVIDTYLVSALSTLSRALDKLGHVPQDGGADPREIENELNLLFAQNVAYYFGENAFSIRNQAYDDMLWVVLGWLESIKSIRTHSQLHYRPVSDSQTKPWHGTQFIEAFAHRARVFYEITTRGWDTELCGGGMVWNPSLGPYKNAITNELYIAASVGMYLYFPGDYNTSPFMLDDARQLDLEPAEPHDPEYLVAAVDGYNWLKNSGMTNDKGLYVDGFHVSNWKRNGTKCDIRNNMVYTYNQGVILSALKGLWEGTGNQSYLEDGHRLARNVIRATGWHLKANRAAEDNAWAGVGRDGILEEQCDSHGRCDQNGQTFKGIFFHHLTLFCEPLPLEPLVPGKTHVADKILAHLHYQSCQGYAAWVAHNARAAMSTQDENGRFGTWWGAKDGIEPAPMPEDAIDYRNNATELLKWPWSISDVSQWSNVFQHFGEVPMLDENGQTKLSSESLRYSVSTLETVRGQLGTNSDLNDRGRGRTVETQGGGVAVLRALWELLNMA